MFTKYSYQNLLQDEIKLISLISLGNKCFHWNDLLVGFFHIYFFFFFFWYVSNLGLQVTQPSCVEQRAALNSGYMLTIDGDRHIMYEMIRL